MKSQSPSERSGTAPLLPACLDGLNERFTSAPPSLILQWGLNMFGGGFALGTGFGPSGVALLHMLAGLDRNATVFYLDTGLLFPETYALRDRLAERLGLTFTPVPALLSVGEQANAYGDELWAHNPDRCCALRKIEPLRRFLAGRTAWVTGLRRDQSSTRHLTGVVERDPLFDVVKLNPLAHWTASEVWGYLHLHDLPYNPLHDVGFASVGCMPCTRAVAPGEHARAGRWAGRAKTECGIHLSAQAS